RKEKKRKEKKRKEKKRKEKKRKEKKRKEKKRKEKKRKKKRKEKKRIVVYVLRAIIKIIIARSLCSCPRRSRGLELRLRAIMIIARSTYTSFCLIIPLKHGNCPPGNFIIARRVIIFL